MERRYAHGYIQTARGALIDEDYQRCADLLAEAVDKVKDIEEDRDALLTRLHELEGTA